MDVSYYDLKQIDRKISMWQCHYACVLREFFLERLIQNFLKEKEKKKFSFFFLIPPSFPTNSFPEACATEHVTLIEGWSCGNSWPKSRGDSAEKGKGRLLSRLLQSWPEILNSFKILPVGLPWWCSAKTLHCQWEGHGFNPWSGK